MCAFLLSQAGLIIGNEDFKFRFLADYGILNSVKLLTSRWELRMGIFTT